MTYFNSDPKPVTHTNEDYLKFIRGQECFYPLCCLPGEPHHPRRLYWGAGTSKKPHDYVAIPVCREHHKPKYENAVKLELIIIEYLMKYIESKRRNRK